MSPEREVSPENIAKIAIINPEQFNFGCDNLVDYQVPQSTYDNLAKILRQGRNVVLVTNHQSYFEIETQRHFSQAINELLDVNFQSYLLYSAPAVDYNIGSLLAIRNPIYKQVGLNMLGIVRKEDYHHPKYQYNITPEMEVQSKQNIRKFNEVLSGSGNLIIFPFESTLEGGRIDPQTQKIKGLQLTDPSCLDVFINRNHMILPCGIDGSYKLINPQSHQPSRELIESILYGKSNQKLVTFRTGSIIDPQYQKDLKLSSEQIGQQIILEVARLLPPESRGVYTQYF